MTIILNSEIENLIHHKVVEGLYKSPSEAIEEAIRLLDEKDQYKKYVNQAILEAEESIAEGKYYTATEFRQRMSEYRQKFITND